MGTPSQQIPLDQIAMVPENAPRKFEILKNCRTLGDAEADYSFVDHLQSNGLLQPIGIAHKPKGLRLPRGKKYIVVWGNRRFQAMTSWLEKKIRAEVQKKVIEAKEKAADLAQRFDPKPFDKELKTRLAEMPSHISAIVVDTDDPLMIAAKNFQENAARVDPHWTDTAARALLLSHEARKRAGKNGYPKTYGNGTWVGEVLGLSKSMSNNYLRCARLLSPKLWDLARRDQGVMQLSMAIKLAGVGKDAPNDEDRFAIQWAEFEKLTGTAPVEESDNEPKRDSVSRPGLDELETKLADVMSGGYADKQPPKKPKGSHDYVDGFTGGYSAGFNEALIIALKYATGKRKSFPKPGGKK